MEVNAPQTAPTTLAPAINAEMSNVTNGILPGGCNQQKCPPQFQLPFPQMPQPVYRPQDIFQVFQNMLGMLLNMMRTLMQQLSPPTPQPYTDPSLRRYVGLPAQQAEALARASGITNVRIIPQGSTVTMEYQANRLNLYVDARGIVREPTWG